WSTTAASNGSHTLTARARDAAGNATTSSTVTVTVSNDTSPPTASITSPSSSPTACATITVTATASANRTSVVYVDGVEHERRGGWLRDERSSACSSVPWTTTGASNGSHTLTARARDAAGNTTTSSAVTVTVFNDTSPPTVSITSPSSGSTVSGTITVTASASDNVGVAGVQFLLDGTVLGADTSSPSS